MIALLIIDMQVGLFEGDSPRYDAEGVIHRINEIAKVVRATGDVVIFVQHEDNGNLKRGTRGWEILPSLERKASDLLVHKQACDSFYETGLADVLERHDLLAARRDALEKMAERLLEVETLERPEIEALVGRPVPARPPSSTAAVAEGAGDPVGTGPRRR